MSEYVPWQENEDGPWCKHCACKPLEDGTCGDEDHGWPTVVKIVQAGTAPRPMLLCFGHTGEAGLAIQLPEVRPANWPEMKMADVARLVGAAE